MGLCGVYIVISAEFHILFGQSNSLVKLLSQKEKNNVDWRALSRPQFAS